MSVQQATLGSSLGARAQIGASLSPEGRELVELAVTDGPYSNNSDLLEQALQFYLNADADDVAATPHAVAETGEWKVTATVSSALYDSVSMLVRHPHTPWGSRAQFLRAALAAYADAKFAEVVR